MTATFFAVTQKVGGGFLGTFRWWSPTIFPNSMQNSSLLLLKCYLAWGESYFWALQLFQMFTGPSFQINYIYQVHSFSVDSNAPQELCIWLSKALPGKIHRSGKHSKHSCLQDRANFHRSRAWQIALLASTAKCFWFMKMSECYNFVPNEFTNVKYIYVYVQQIVPNKLQVANE